MKGIVGKFRAKMGKILSRRILGLIAETSKIKRRTIKRDLF
jgi:hypothetical protein